LSYESFAQEGSFIVCQNSNALRRLSSSHSGSPFLAEIKRIMSALSPFGAVSASMSVTKPYLYLSPLSSMISGRSLFAIFLCFSCRRGNPRPLLFSSVNLPPMYFFLPQIASSYLRVKEKLNILPLQ